MTQMLLQSKRIVIDHGWEFIKTLHFTFLAGVNEILSEPAFFDNVVEYNGKYYKIGTKRGAVMDSKVETDDYYILTLAAVAMELKYMGLHEANIVIGAGLPATRYGAEKKGFVEYLSRNQDVAFKFEGEEYKVKIEKVAMFLLLQSPTLILQKFFRLPDSFHFHAEQSLLFRFLRKAL